MMWVHRKLLRLLRGIVGNPFHNNDEVVGRIARANPAIKIFAAHIYLTSSFYRVPVLARLIVNAEKRQAVDPDELLNSAHVKGSWLVDAALGID